MVYMTGPQKLFMKYLMYKKNLFSLDDSLAAALLSEFLDWTHIEIPREKKNPICETPGFGRFFSHQRVPSARQPWSAHPSSGCSALRAAQAHAGNRLPLTPVLTLFWDL